jgi:hypothetical protein
MKYVIVTVCLGILLTAATVRGEPHPEVRKAFNLHWMSHPEHPEQVARMWHDRLFHGRVEAPLLARILNDLRRGVEAPIALAAMLASPEFYISVGSSYDAWVRRTFLELCGRPPTDAEYRFWYERMHHADRAQVAHEMVQRYPPAWAMTPAAPVEHYEYRPPVVTYHR